MMKVAVGTCPEQICVALCRSTETRPTISHFEHSRQKELSRCRIHRCLYATLCTCIAAG